MRVLFTGQITVKKTKWNKRDSMALAWLLCLALCVESTPLSVSAAQPVVAAAEMEPQTQASAEPQTPESGEGATGDSQKSETGNAADGAEETGFADTDGPETPEEGGAAEGESSQPGENGGTAEGETPQPDEGGEEAGNKPQPEENGESGREPQTPEESGQQTPEADDADTVSENDLPSVSENALSTVSENSLDTEREAMIQKAQEAFAALLSKKPLMALLYHTDAYEVRSEADGQSRAAAVLDIGQTLYIQGVEITQDDVWYRARYLLDGAEGAGFVQSYYLAYSDEDWLAWEEEYLLPILEAGEDVYENTAYGMRAFSMMTYAADASDISAFPGSYQAALRSLKNAHPNWTFVPMRTGLDFNTSVSKEMGDKSLIQKTTDNVSKGWVGSACHTESGWYYATQPAVAYHMDPRNFLTETYIFQFEQLTFNASYHTESAVQTFLNNTFMKGKLADDAAGRTYARAFYEIGSSRKLSPIHLASRVYQEQGQGTSGLISGTYPGYEGYYNFFNVGVNGSSTEEKIVKGLTYAKNKGWNTRYKSLEGGAATIGNNYILKGQDTIYLEKFNVDKNSTHGVYNHQYMQNIQAPRSESSSTKKMYASAGSLNSAFVFKIPVFDNMPGENLFPLEGISVEPDTATLRRPDTVVTAEEDIAKLSETQKKENTSTVSLQVSFLPENTTSDRTIVWTSANPRIATVKADPEDSSKAVVTAVGTGEVKITAKASKSGNLTAGCMVYVTAPIYRLELSDPGTEEGNGKTILFKGQSVNLNAEYWPKDTTSDTTIRWKTSDENVAVVKNGRVTAKAEGQAVITAEVAGYEKSYDVSVESCSVIFHREDKSELTRLSLGYGESVGAKQMPKLQPVQGKIFRGWYTAAGGQGSVFAEETPVYARETHLYPHYQEVGQDAGFYVIPVGDQIYTGSAIKPKVRVFDGTVAEDGSLLSSDGSLTGEQGEVLELVEGRDYTLSYKNNKNVNAEGKPRPTIVVKGKGNYAGTQNVCFDILPKALTDSDITAQDITAAYSGKTIKSAPAVYRNGKRLAAKRDYAVSYPQTGTGAYNKPGVYPIVITGKGGYRGTITVYETITRDVLLNKVSVAKIPKQTYSNECMKQKGGIRPDALTVTYKKQPLLEGVHYTVSYKDDQSIGKATVTLTAVEGSGYAGSRSVTYQIVGTSIAKAKVEGLENKEYVAVDKEWDEESAAYEAAYQKMIQTPGAYRLTLGDRVLVESKDGVTGDYVVSYGGAAKRGAVKAGTAAIVFRGINEYSGQIKKTYKLLPCEWNEERVGEGRDFTLSYYTQDEPETDKPLSDINGIAAPYVKGGAKPVVLVAFRGQLLEPGKDYKISYKNNKALTTADMEENRRPAFTITGKGNFKGKLTGSFVITDGQFDKQTDDRCKVTMTLKDVVYREKKGAYQTKAVLRDIDGTALTAGKDYDKSLQYTYEEDTQAHILQEGELKQVSRKAGEAVSEEDIVPAGTTLRVTARGIGPYAGNGTKMPEISALYRIVSADFAKAKVKTERKSYQDGRPVTLLAADLIVTMGGMSEPLVLGRDYVIVEGSYVNHTKKGKAKVTIKGIGNYGGEKTITYTIGAKTLFWGKE